MRALYLSCLAFTLMGFSACSWTGRAVQVVSNEVDPAVLQAKYEWFKDTYSQLQADKANISVLQARMDQMKAIGHLDRTDREQLMIYAQEVAGVKAAYNDLAAQYNSEMAKWNWRFCNVGTLPAGATQPLPRNVAPFEED